MTQNNKNAGVLLTTWEYAKVLVGALLLASLIRAVWFEPFKIPSSSMVPTLLIGDYLFVNKYEYGLRNPCTGTRYGGAPIARGDVVVFEKQKGWACGMLLGLGSVNFIKRVVALPGDRVAYINKRLFVNNKQVPLIPQGEFIYRDSGDVELHARLYDEIINGTRHDVLLMPERPGVDVPPMTVPEGMYVVMGDNRDNSLDSRAWHYPSWGFVKKEDIVGHAAMIFWSWDQSFSPRFDRMFSSLHAEEAK